MVAFLCHAMVQHMEIIEMDKAGIKSQVVMLNGLH